MYKRVLVLLGVIVPVQVFAQVFPVAGVGDGGGDGREPQAAPAHITCDVEYNEQVGQDYLKLVSRIEQDVDSKISFDLDQLSWKVDIGQGHKTKQMRGGSFTIQTFIAPRNQKFTTMLVTSTPEYKTPSGENLYSNDMEFFESDETAVSRAGFTAYVHDRIERGVVVSVKAKCLIQPSGRTK
jgi:hypothetical protein